MTDFVYFVVHQFDLQPFLIPGLDPTPPPTIPPPAQDPIDTFVPGNLFSFLTQDETELFLLNVQNANAEIDRQVESDLSIELADLFSRGLGSTSLACNAECGAETDRVRLKREATAIVVQQILDASGLVLDLFAFAEIEDFNCREYPNWSFECSSLSALGLPSITCTIDLPCR